MIDGVDITALSEDALARLRGTRIGFVFQFFHLLPSLTAFENVLVPMEIAGRPEPRRRARRRCSPKSASRTAAITIRRSSRAASSSASRSRARSPTIRRSCWPTSRPAISTATTGRHVIDLLLQINRSRKTTLVLVTHDPELAAIADMTIALRDGRVVAAKRNAPMARRTESTDWTPRLDRRLTTDD